MSSNLLELIRCADIPTATSSYFISFNDIQTVLQLIFLIASIVIIFIGVIRYVFAVIKLAAKKRSDVQDDTQIEFLRYKANKTKAQMIAMIVIAIILFAFVGVLQVVKSPKISSIN